MLPVAEGIQEAFQEALSVNSGGAETRTLAPMKSRMLVCFRKNVPQELKLRARLRQWRGFKDDALTRICSSPSNATVEKRDVPILYTRLINLWPLPA
jgi:hypothetical protein